MRDLGFKLSCRVSSVVRGLGSCGLNGDKGTPVNDTFGERLYFSMGEGDRCLGGKKGGFGGVAPVSRAIYNKGK